MTYLHNEPAAFLEELIEGLIAAYPDRLTAVPGGVARASAVPAGQVAVVIGGGSGHYPAFAGLVGPGLAHGAAMGNVFASPSAGAVYSVAKAVEAGGGILLSYGNYAGDVLNFDQAQERLRAEGIDCRTVAVADDITSAPPDERSRRRGVAGDLCVFKAAAHAAELGKPLDEVYAVAKRAAERTCSMGVAFGGATLPGASEPLFSVPKGRMAIGMGLHGEPGLREADLGTAEEVAKLLVEGLLADLPEGLAGPAGQRVAVITNGLGDCKYEELFILHRSIDRLLKAAGLTIVQPDVGEIATSFDMAGCSLTLLWLDDELEAAWTAPADAPGYRKGSPGAAAPAPTGSPQAAGQTGGRPLGPGPRTAAQTGPGPRQAAPASPDSRAAAQVVARAIGAAADRIDAIVGELGALDAVAGDGDHGIGMQRGATAARRAAAASAAGGAGAGTTLADAADAWADRAGGTSGAIWGIILRTMGGALGDQDAPTAQSVARAVKAAGDAVTAFGKARVGDKTLVDALAPFAEALERQAAGGDLAAAWAAAAPRARLAAESTRDLAAKIGRARPHAEKSLGTPDPGAISLAAIVEAVGGVLAK
ncbi:MAG: dihydroxyacetone kinase family protein [Bifidobacteriaceae bacterium]|jgi:dihydroxyacetone kinase|nr:dihydroxyacetone kinase family protein [Bifidobacteriaceae bacterium]